MNAGLIRCTPEVLAAALGLPGHRVTFAAVADPWSGELSLKVEGPKMPAVGEGGMPRHVSLQVHTAAPLPVATVHEFEVLDGPIDRAMGWSAPPGQKE